MKKALILFLFTGFFKVEGFPLKEMGMSLLVPGLGQWYTGNKKKAVLFGGAEATIWLGYFGFRIHRDRLFEDYRIYGMSHAGADASNNSGDYWEAVELFASYEDYIEYMRRVARNIYPDDLEAQRRYLETHAVKGNWEWKTKEEWFTFQDIIKSWRVADTRARLMLFTLVINRIASALDILLYYKTGSRDVGFAKNLRLRSVMVEPQNMFLGLTFNF